MFGRKSRSENEAQAEAALRPQREGAKNRPTPKRKEQEAARRRPLVGDPKRAKASDREARREASTKMRQAMVTGDDRHLPPRDKGPVRRFVRDCVDARFSLGEFLLPIMLVVLVLSLLTPRLASIVFLLVYVIAGVAIVDAVLLWRRTKAKILAKFGASTQTRGLALYCVMRAFQMRRTRMPRPQVTRGETVS